MSRIALEVPTVQLVNDDWAVRGLQNEKYIYLDFAWILRARSWGVGWLEIGLVAVVLVARPFILPCIRMRPQWRVWRCPNGRVTDLLQHD